MLSKKWLVTITSCMLFGIQGTSWQGLEGTRFRARPSLDSQIYQAIWALNIPLVTSMLAEHETLSVQEKEQLLDIARYRAALCGQKRISLGDKVERGVKALYSVVGGVMILRLGDAFNVVKTAFNNNWIGSWISGLLGGVKESAARSDKLDVNLLAYLADAPITLTIGGALILLGGLRLFSVLIAVGNDQDARQAEEIVRMISILPVRN